VLETVSQTYYSSSPKPALVCRGGEGEVLLLQIFQLGFWSGYYDIRDQPILFIYVSCSKLAEGHVIPKWLEWDPNDSKLCYSINIDIFSLLLSFIQVYLLLMCLCLLQCAILTSNVILREIFFSVVVL
jgi:hypothetical protein